jgi:hypothetical protein
MVCLVSRKGADRMVFGELEKISLYIKRPGMD